jgi:hypothetical protein
MQQLTLGLALIALVLSGYAVMDEPAASGPQADDARVKAMQEEFAQLREELYTMKNSGGAQKAPAMPSQDFGYDSSATVENTAPPGSEPMPDEPEMMGMETQEFPPADPMMVAQIQQVLRQERNQRRDERRGKHLERFAVDLAERLANSEHTSGMSQEDRDSLSEILSKERASMGKLYRGLRSGDLSRKDARLELKDMRADTISIVRESMGDDVANALGELSPLPRRGPLANSTAK